ncbi:MAG: hypothetical protein J6A95_06870 [Clostridia bacterium]|nr:hypothetical protein [Clostridia bacterium]
MKNSDKAILFWARFWNYGILVLSFSVYLVLGIIALKTDNQLLAEISVLALPALTFIVTGVYYLIGISKETVHMHCVWQSIKRIKMDPYNNNWTKKEKRQFKLLASTFIAIGAFVLAAYLMLVAFGD